MTTPRVHHCAICTTDVGTSLRFWRDGLGFEQLMDHEFTGDWPHLFHAPSDRLRSIFLGDPHHADSGIVELVEFIDDHPTAPTRPAPEAEPTPPTGGFLLLSLYADIDRTLERLAALELGGEPRITEVAAGVRMAVVRDPNGVMVELIGGPADQHLNRLID